ncbi:hypothetical protein AUEXF2481DRAFT_29434 [Aureobasidium subglaciale EXF-2481]|uniref:Rhodopsin domain-containing protein n=1 Tax=Aureobasidium subglaciale (strain EXF-2481) TaxID=1043005 RepID=A0A074YC80_AURSE|nr:uncharacterized protein AUEXF2481DRAFT_29434 [Aureobasidium subglaciale EXF-2481]KEQ95350.1 hypothetical protein AUEXF2481DRAFT_29434 [Aureobasidium subglaciale EXF-2481]
MSKYQGVTDLKPLILQLNATQQSALLDRLFSIARASNEDIDLSPPVVRIVWVLLAMSTIVVTTRLAVKYRTTRRLYLDDGLMAVALVLGWVHAVFLQVSFTNGLGRHVYFLEPAQRYLALKYGFISLVWSYLCPLFGRLSFCAFLLCVAETDPRTKKWPIWIFIVLQIIVNVLASVLLLSTCGTHIEDLWLLNLGNYFEYCLPVQVQTDYAYFAGSFNTFTDLFLTIQPAMLIVHTKLATSNKIGVASLFCLSIIAMIAAVVRTVAAHILNDVGDYTYELTPYITWVSVELNVVLTVTSLPLLRPLAQEARERATRMLSVNRKTKEPWDDTISLRSIHTHTQNDEKSKTGAGVGVVALSATPAHNGFVAQQDPEAVIRTVEVEISYEKNETPMIHAALVGLVQGQAMERLAGR